VPSKNSTVKPEKVAPVRSKGAAAVVAFGEFWIDFIVGDDWRIAAGIVISFILTATIKVSAFTFVTVPVFVAAFLAYSLSRVVRALK